MFDNLEEVLGATDYMPSFMPQQPKKKSLFKPIKQIQKPTIVQKQKNEQPIKRTTMMNIHKAASVSNNQKPDQKLSKTSNAKQWDVPFLDLPDINETTRNPLPSYSVNTINPPKTPSAKQQSDQPIYVQRGMKPPLSRKGSEKSMTQNFQISKTNQLAQTNYLLNIPLNGTINQNLQKTLKANDQDLNKLKQVYQQQIKSLKQFYEKQSQTQKKFFEKRLNEMKENAQKQKQSRQVIFKEQLQKKLQLKDLQIKKLKQLHQMELQSKKQQIAHVQNMNNILNKVNKNTEVIQNWSHKNQQQKFKANFKMQQLQQQQNKIKKINQQIQDKLKKKQLQLDQRQKNIREMNNKEKLNLEKEYKRLQVMQENILQKQKKLQKDFLIKEENLNNKHKQIKIEYEKKMRELELLQDNLNHQKSLLKQTQIYYQNKHTQLMQEKTKLLSECNEQKRNLTSKQIQLEEKLRTITLRQSQVEYLRQELKGKTNLLDMEKKRYKIENTSQKQPISMKNNYYNPDLQARLQKLNVYKNQNPYEPMLKKSITALKDEYMKSISNANNGDNRQNNIRSSNKMPKQYSYTSFLDK